MTLVQLSNLLKFVPDAEEVSFFSGADYPGMQLKDLLPNRKQLPIPLDWQAVGVQGSTRKCHADAWQT